MAMDYTNFYTVYYWMSKLKTKKVVKGGIKMEPLAGVAKDLYALIFRFSHGKNGCCNMSYKTMEDVTGVPKSTLIRNLKLLEERLPCRAAWNRPYSRCTYQDTPVSFRLWCPPA